MKALVIDDSRAIRLILGRMLREFGFDVDEAENGRAALERFRNGDSPALVLVDWNMPEMNGIDFCEAVRRPPNDFFVFMVTATTETEVPQVIRALDAGADEYIMKP